jgi:GNAT superfamily N-acetyltransferase
MDQLIQLTRHLEFVSARAWPAEESEDLDGWTIRAAKGITWRANTVLPHSQLRNISLDSAINKAIEFYRERNIPPAFKMTNCCFPKNLDQILYERGFRKEMETYVQTTPISSRYDTNGKFTVRMVPKIDQDWIAAYQKLGGFDDFANQQRLGIINRIVAKKAFASVRAGGEIIGIGMGVIDYDMLGLFGIVTDPKHRGRGIATSINEFLLEWGRVNGARVSYLQVEKENEPALSLYAKCGFKTVYDYWYRILRNS